MTIANDFLCTKRRKLSIPHHPSRAPASVGFRHIQQRARHKL
jgi:hypothetical protein